MIVDRERLRDVRDNHSNQTIGLRLGCYDLLHPGHQGGIDAVAKRSDIVVVGVMPDRYVSRKKGPDRPIHSEQHRLEAIDQAEGVDYSFVAGANVLAIAGIFRKLRPDIYVESLEYGESRLKAMFLRSIGTEYQRDDRCRPYSTTAMIAQLGMAEAMAKASLDYFPPDELTKSS